jgi:hypothetical protein
MSSKDKNSVINQEKQATVFLSKEIVLMTDPSNFRPIVISHMKNVQTKNRKNFDPILKNLNEIRPIVMKDENIQLKLLLDLDETLVSFSDFSDATNAVRANKKLLYKKIEAYGQQCYVIYPIYIEQLVQNISKYYSIVIYSRGSNEYVEEVVKILDKTGTLIPKRNIIFREDQSALKDFQKAKILKVSDKNTLILDDNVNVWNNYEKIYPIFIFSKYFLNNQNSFNKVKIIEYYFKKDNPDFRLNSDYNDIFLTMNDDHEERLQNIEGFLIKVADKYYDLVAQYPNYNFMWDIKNILREFRNDVLSEREYFILSDSKILMNCVEFVLQSLGAVICTIYSKDVTILVDNHSMNLARHISSSSSKLYNIKFAFDCFFYGKAMDLKKYEIS